MRVLRSLRMLSLLALASTALRAQDVFPYEFAIDNLDNGLRLVTVPTEHSGIVSVYIVVAVGSRNEVEPGKTGFAHFFEHMMFRGSKNYSSAEQTAIFKKAGADRNAYTTDDYTCYHTTFSKADLDLVLQVEADRFQNLLYSRDDFRTEAKAILGEYNTSSANPLNKLFEAQRETAFDRHTYRHTTMGFLRDIEKMPEQYEYSRAFFARFYRPQNTTIMVVGDVRPAEVLSLVRKHWDRWRSSDAGALPELRQELGQQRARTCHVPWTSPTSPWVIVSFKGPAFSTTALDMATMDVIASVAFSENSEIYQRLFVQEGKVDALFANFADHVDPYLVSVCARVKRLQDLGLVQREIQGAFERLATEPVPTDQIVRAVSNLKYRLAAQCDSPDGVAQALAGYVALSRTPAAVNDLHRLYERITPRDILRVAQTYFVESGRTVATLAHGDPSRDAGGDESAGRSPDEPPIGSVLQPTPSPLITFRVLFRTGAAFDPPGKAGLAYVTARLLARGSTREHSYEEIVARLFPMAAQIGFQVDKEMTVFYGTVHRHNVRSFQALLQEMLLRPAFDVGDLDRVKANTVSFLDDGLRRSDAEELGKEVLYNDIYRDHPYGHHNAGCIESVSQITLDDVKAFYTANYTPDRVTLGLAGGFSKSLPWMVADALVRGLPPAPAEPVAAVAISRPRPPERTTMTIVKKQMGSTGLHIGIPLAINRSHPDWAALWLMRSYFGEHRSDNSYLYQRLREIRGLNYGDYAYIEYFPNGSRQFQPDPNLARRSQIFQIWLRPVESENGPFALKAAIYELRKLIADGLSPEAFEATRTYLSKNIDLLVKTQDRRLGYDLDSRYYEIDPFVPHLRNALAWLKVEDVNRAIRKHLRADRLYIVAVTEDAENFRDRLLASGPTPVQYGSAPAAEILEEDKVIEALRLDLREEDVKIVEVDEVFR